MRVAAGIAGLERKESSAAGMGTSGLCLGAIGWATVRAYAWRARRGHWYWDFVAVAVLIPIHLGLQGAGEHGGCGGWSFTSVGSSGCGGLEDAIGQYGCGIARWKGHLYERDLNLLGEEVRCLGCLDTVRTGIGQRGAGGVSAAGGAA